MGTMRALTADERGQCLEHNLDPENEFVIHAVLSGDFLRTLELNPPPELVRARMRMMCPVSSDYPMPGNAPPTPPGHCRGPVGDRVESKYPFGDMAIGSSFPLPPTMDAYAVRSAANYFQAKTGTRFRFRRGRCWRWW